VLRFETGVATNTFKIKILPDRAAEPPETVKLTLRNPAGASLGLSHAVLTILDDDP